MQNKTFVMRERPIVFRCFSRKGYALFSCMGREVLISVLSVATLTSAAPRLAAQSLQQERRDAATRMASAADTLQLGEATVQASRAPLAANVVARQVMTLTRDDLAAAGITSVNDALKLCAGVDVRQRGGFGIQSDISINGGTFDQITILVNGQAVTNPQTGHNAADFPLNLQDIERIEILEGAASRVFGSQAFSGAINVVTRQGGDRLNLQLSGGSYGTAKAEARTAWQVAPHLQTSVSGSFQRSDGAVKNGNFIGGKAYWQGHYDTKDVRVDAQVGATINDFGANTFYSGAYPNQWEATRRYLVGVQAETKGRVHFSPQLSWLRSTDHYQLIRNTSTGENFHRGDVFTLGLNAWTQWALGRTAIGAELREEGIYSTNLGRPLAENLTIPIPGQHGLRYTLHDDRTNLSYFVEHNVVLSQWTFSAGVMALRNSAIDHKFRFYPGIDLCYRPSAAWKVYASWSRSLRLPTFTDLYYKSPTQEGNVGLRPETCSATRIGAIFKHKAVSIDVKGFYNHGTDMIDWVMRSADDIYHSANFQLNTFGAGLCAAFDLNAVCGGRGPLQRFVIDYNYLYQHRRDDEPFFKSNYAMEYLRHNFTARLDHRIWQRLNASWTLRVHDREGAYLLYQDAVATGELKPYGAHALLDLKLRWTAPRYEFFVDMQNLTSHRYYDLANVRQPGFLLMAGASLRLP